MYKNQSTVLEVLWEEQSKVHNFDDHLKKIFVLKQNKTTMKQSGHGGERSFHFWRIEDLQQRIFSK